MAGYTATPSDLKIKAIFFHTLRKKEDFFATLFFN